MNAKILLTAGAGAIALARLLLTAPALASTLTFGATIDQLSATVSSIFFPGASVQSPNLSGTTFNFTVDSDPSLVADGEITVPFTELLDSPLLTPLQAAFPLLNVPAATTGLFGNLVQIEPFGTDDIDGLAVLMGPLAGFSTTYDLDFGTTKPGNFAFTDYNTTLANQCYAFTCELTGNVGFGLTLDVAGLTTLDSLVDVIGDSELAVLQALAGADGEIENAATIDLAYGIETTPESFDLAGELEREIVFSNLNLVIDGNGAADIPEPAIALGLVAVGGWMMKQRLARTDHRALAS